MVCSKRWAHAHQGRTDGARTPQGAHRWHGAPSRPLFAPATQWLPRQLPGPAVAASAACLAACLAACPPITAATSLRRPGCTGGPADGRRPVAPNARHCLHQEPHLCLAFRPDDPFLPTHMRSAGDHVTCVLWGGGVPACTNSGRGLSVFISAIERIQSAGQQP